MADAAAEPRRSVRRVVRRSRAWPVHGQSRRTHPHRRAHADAAALVVAAMDLLRARLQGPAPQRLGRQLHRAVLPRRGDRARRRPPALLRMPAPRCDRVRRMLAAELRACRSGRAPPTWTTSCTRSGSTAATSGGTRMPFADLPDGAFVVIDGRAFAVRGDSLLYWAPDGYATRQRAARERLRPTCSRRRRSSAVLAAGYSPRWHPSSAGDRSALHRRLDRFEARRPTSRR